MRRPSAWLTGLVLTACATAAPAPPPPVAAPAVAAVPADEPVPALQLPADVRPLRYRLELTIDPDQPRFSGTAEIDVELQRPRRVLWLHGLELDVSASTVTVGQEVVPARYEQVNDDGVVKLSLPREVGPGTATLRLAWSRPFDPRVVGLYLAKEAGTAYAYTQFEDIYARRAFPGFDEPRFKTPFEVTLVVPEGDVAVANTAAVAEAPAGKGLKRLRHAPTRPLPTYLLAWAVGPFDVVEAPPLPPTAVRSWPVPMRGITPKGRGGELGFALQAARELLLAEEAYFGLPYPYPKLDSVAVPDYAYGAMENAGAIHYKDDLLLVKEGVTSEARKALIASVIAHEQAHQWFGDLVTMPWWDEAWLNESFATWLAAAMVESWRPGYHAALDLQKDFQAAMNADALASARAIRQPLKSVKDIQGQFDSLTYDKGGGVLAMFERWLGPEAFRQGVRDYIRAHADGSGSTADLLAALARAAGREVAGPFHGFLDQAGVPLVKVQVACGERPALALAQSRYLPLGTTATSDRTWQVPVCARFSAGGTVGERCTLLEGATGRLELPACPAWVMPNAQGAGYYRWSLSGEDLKKLVGAGYAQLSAPERVSLASAMRASVMAGELPIADALAALGPLAADAEGEVAMEALPLLRFARDRVLPQGQEGLADAYAVKLFAPVLKRLGTAARPGDTPSTRALRTAVLELLARAGHPEAVREATRLGRAYAGLADGRFHPEAVDPDLQSVVLGVAVEHGDRAFFDALKARLVTTEDSATRARLLSALGQARDPQRAAAALALSLDPALRVQEAFVELRMQTQDRRTRDGAWRFLQDNFDRLVAKAPPTHAAYLPYVATAFCDAEHADQVHAFFSGRAERHNGMSSNLKQAEEAVRLCAAQADAQRESARRFFTAQAPGRKVEGPVTR